VKAGPWRLSNKLEYAHFRFVALFGEQNDGFLRTAVVDVLSFIGQLLFSQVKVILTSYIVDLRLARLSPARLCCLEQTYIHACNENVITLRNKFMDEIPE